MSFPSLPRRITMACCLGTALLLAGCASLAPTPDTTTQARPSVSGGFVLDGRFSLTQRAAMQAEQRHSGRLHWKYVPGTPASSKILLSSPLGQGIAEIVQDAHGARLTTAEGKALAAPDAETLTREALGYALPLAQLANWVRAHPPEPSIPGSVEAHRDELGRLTRLRLEEWLIDYEYADANPHALPRRIHALRPEAFELRLIVDAWQHPSADTNAP